MSDDAATGAAGFSANPAGRGGAPRASALEDPVVRSGRREGLWTLALWLAAMIYTVTYCTFWGYGRPIESLSFVLWFPDWVFWGIVVPWGACTVVSIYFALYVIEDDPLASADDAASEDAPPDDPAAGRGTAGA
ncbi:MAG TPA: hypothetical protein VHY91_25720 [Pirellulales bacterium]|jgi:hypothetical protein|nr:hypothetical protein [Pirellulales bacterium]